MLGDDAGPEQWRWGPHPNDPSPSAWTHIPRDLPPAFEALGVSKSDIDAMLIGAPAAFLSGGRRLAPKAVNHAYDARG